MYPTGLSGQLGANVGRYAGMAGPQLGAFGNHGRGHRGMGNQATVAERIQSFEGYDTPDMHDTHTMQKHGRQKRRNKLGRMHSDFARSIKVPKKRGHYVTARNHYRSKDNRKL